MIPIADTRTYPLSRFTIREQPRRDNPYWSQFLIFLREKLVGAQFSRPCLSDCEWFVRWRGKYADEEQSHVVTHRYSIRPRGRPTNAERAAREAEPVE